MNRSKGFTLIELMIAVAIVGILAAIAYPSYQDSVRKSRRATAEGCLLELAQWMERYYTTNLRYDRNAAGAAVALPATSCRNDLDDYYDFAFNGVPTASAYALQAAPQGPQSADRCGTLGVNQTGVRSSSGDNVDVCWRK
ncbi:MAG: type IV pilin protein [Pseudomonadota bacterium]